MYTGTRMQGTDALDVLNGNLVELHHGFVGVVNRSQYDINQQKSIHAAIRCGTACPCG